MHEMKSLSFSHLADSYPECSVGFKAEFTALIHTMCKKINNQRFPLFSTSLRPLMEMKSVTAFQSEYLMLILSTDCSCLLSETYCFIRLRVPAKVGEASGREVSTESLSLSQFWHESSCSEASFYVVRQEKYNEALHNFFNFSKWATVITCPL